MDSAGLKRVCRNWCRRSAARSFFPLDRGLTPAAKTNDAAARLLSGQMVYGAPLSAACNPSCTSYNSCGIASVMVRT
jgi:hypothetical protein